MTMNAIVPDTFQGAVILSVIDFFLSFLIISGIGFILSMFPLLNKVADMFGGHKTHAAKPAKPAERKPEAPKSVAIQQPLEDMAAIAAALRAFAAAIRFRPRIGRFAAASALAVG